MEKLKSYTRPEVTVIRMISETSILRYSVSEFTNPFEDEISM